MIENAIRGSIETKENLLSMVPAIEKAGNLITNALKDGKKVLVAGNGGSAAQAQHFSAELVIRYCKERGRHYPAIALNTDSSIITACGNDYGYDEVFAKQVEAYGQAGDIFVAISTSGNSPNILKAMAIAKEKGMVVIGLAGRDGGKMECENLLIVPSHVTARIQEAHILIIHIWCEMFDNGIGAA
ncbi:MAG: SIS domain-containing protein [Candidatus Nanoarchaeia archaeon]